MDEAGLRRLLEEVASGAVRPEDAALRMRMEPFEDMGFAKVDHHRGIRQGVPEVIFGATKTPEQIASIAESILRGGDGSVIITRMSREAADHVASRLPLKYDEVSRVGIAGKPTEERRGKVSVITAGTSDIPVAEEAAVTAEALGNSVVRIYDAGVSGLHRLLSHSEDVMSSKAIVAVAGMEGALASVVGGLASCPVIAVPTSVGYGASFGGVAALLAMLNSCASGVSVVNIDNGFGAGYIASLINRSASERGPARRTFL
ncbi:MAG: nickel pincer cofactor biosynthesis protein LarB [Thermoplasmata archaeon]|nr:nickel pincer cofactor biosynthesis protein LarB [Thermoplasmata archaeon]